MEKTFSLNVISDRELHDVSNMLFGIFLEDINFACDGGLNANMVSNSSFDGIYLSRKGYNVLTAFVFKAEPHAVIDRLRYWILRGGKLESCHEDPVAENSWYAGVQLEGQCRLENRGFNGAKRHPAACAMSIQAGQEYEFSCWARSRNYQGSITVSVTDESGAALTANVQLTPTRQWQQSVLILSGTKTGCGKLVMQFEGKGAVELDGISLMSTDTWGRGDPKWSQGKLRRDLVEALRDLNPKFMRFPGGCIVEGNKPGNEYTWKDTVGPVINRKGKYNLWGAGLKDGGYHQSYQVGFYEFFLLCESLGMEPLPIVFAGLNCQFRSRAVLTTNSAEFQEKVVQNTLDLIEYANGNPKANQWAAVRAEAGHPEPFNLKYIGIGNENFGKDYMEKFDAVKKAVNARYPGIVCVMSAGPFPAGRNLAAAWAVAKSKYLDVRIDEHSYRYPGWFLKNHRRYDNYSRDGARVYLGEYAANFPFLGLKPNCFKTALAEAAFLTGVERNSDVVAMTSYAPLFSLCEGEQWAHNLINFNPAHVLLTANYFVQKMYSTTVGDKVVDMQGELPPRVYASATATRDRLIVKLVNTNRLPLQAQLHLEGIPDGQAKVEYLQSEDLNAANRMEFNGTPEYLVVPKEAEISVKNGSADLGLAPHGFYVLVVNR
jgi:alpha-L-arabinofuranosidase